MRLIDADELINSLNFLYENGVPIDLNAKQVLTKIMEQPTDYDIDKVMKELEEEREKILYSNDYESEIINYCLDSFDRAIEIVENGLEEQDK